MKLFRFVIIQIALIFFPINDANLISNLDSLINEYHDCINIVYFFAPDSTDYKPTRVPVLILARESKAADWVEPLSRSKTHVECVVAFYIFPEHGVVEMNLHDEVRQLSSFQKLNGSNLVPITWHFFSCDFTFVKKHPETDIFFRNLALQVYHYLKPDGVIKSSQIYSASSFFILYFYDESSSLRDPFIKVKPVQKNGNQRQGFEDAAKIILNTKTVNTTQKFKLHDFEAAFLNKLDSPFIQVPATFEEAVRRLCLEMLNSWIDHNTNNYFSVLIHARRTKLRYSVLYNVQNIRHRIVLRSIATVIPTGAEYINFVTCDGVRVGMSLSFYTSPYDLKSWLLFLVLAFLILPLICLLFEKNKILRENWLHFIGNVVQFIISTALEVSPSVPLKTAAKLSRKTKLMFGLWLGLVVTFTNAYKGIVVSHLTAQSPESHTWNNVSDMAGFIFAVSADALNEFEKVDMVTGASFDRIWMNVRGCECFPNEQHFISKFCYKMNRRTVSVGANKGLACGNVSYDLRFNHIILPSNFKDYCKHRETLQPLLVQFTKGGDIRDTDLTTEVYGAFDEMCEPDFIIPKSSVLGGISILPFTNALMFHLEDSKEGGKTQIFPEILGMTSNCYRTGYVDYEKKLDAFFAYTRAKETLQDTLYRKGKNRLLPIWVGFTIQNSHAAEQLTTSFYRLLSSGIYFLWEKWYLQHRMLNSGEEEYILNHSIRQRKSNIPKALHLKSNVSTVFIIYSFCSLLSLISCLAEMTTYFCRFTFTLLN